MATVNTLFAFASSAEGFVGYPGSNITMSYDGSVGNPAGSLKARIAVANNSAYSSWRLTGITWEDLGVPAGATVTHVRLQGASTRCTEYNNGNNTSTIGPYRIYASDGSTVIATIWSGRTVSGSEGSWSTVSQQSDVAVGSSYQASNTSIQIWLEDYLRTSSGAGAAVSTHDDQVSITVTYTAAASTLEVTNGADAADIVSLTRLINVNQLDGGDLADVLNLSRTVNLLISDGFDCADTPALSSQSSTIPLVVNDGFDCSDLHALNATTGGSSGELNLLIQATGDDGWWFATPVSWGDGISSAPDLKIGNNTGYIPDTQLQHLWLRFTGVTIPAGSTITYASITLNAKYSNSYNTIYMTFYGVLAANPSAPTSAYQAENYALSPGLTTNYYTTDIENIDANTDVAFPITSVLQELVNTYNYSSGSAILIVVRADGTALDQMYNVLTWQDYTDTPLGCARLHVEYTAPGGGPATINITDGVDASSASNLNAQSAINLLVNDGFDCSDAPELAHIQPAIVVSPSTYIASSGEATTPQLTPPGTKSTSDFQAGRIQDDENPADSLDLASNRYTELEWSLRVTPSGVDSDVYQFRLTVSGSELTSYTYTPQLTLGGSQPTIQVSDGMDLGDSTAASRQINLDLTDGAETSDTPTIERLIQLQISDGADSADSPGLTKHTGVDLTDGSEVGDTFSYQLAGFLPLTLTDGFDTADLLNLAKAGTSNLQITDGFDTADELLITRQINLNLSDGAEAADLPELSAVVGSLSFNVSDGCDLADLPELAYYGSWDLVFSEGADSADAPSLSLAGSQLIQVTDGFDCSDSFSYTREVNLNLTNGFDSADLASLASGGQSTLSLTDGFDIASLAPTWERQINLTLIDGANTADLHSVGFAGSQIIQITDGFDLSDLNTTLPVRIFLTVNDGLEIANTDINLWQYEFATNDTITFLLDLQRKAYHTLPTGRQVHRTLEIARTHSIEVDL